MDEIFSCKNHKCTSHYKYIKKLYNDIIRYCKEASDLTLPHTSLDNGEDSKVIPGWNEHVQEYADKAKFWHYIWKEDGRK